MWDTWVQALLAGGARGLGVEDVGPALLAPCVVSALAEHQVVQAATDLVPPRFQLTPPQARFLEDLARRAALALPDDERARFAAARARVLSVADPAARARLALAYGVRLLGHLVAERTIAARMRAAARSYVLLRDEATGTVHRCEVETPLVLGRPAPGACPDITCDHPSVSRRHAEVEALPDGRLRVVNRSPNGTTVAGQAVTGEAFARPGDRIMLGSVYALAVQSGHVARGAAATGTSSAELPADSGEAPVLAGPPRLQGVGTRYRLVRELRRGGMGVVYEAVDELFRRPCALKRLLATKVDREHLERFKREALLGRHLIACPAIVAAYDAGLIPGTDEPYMVMELVDGAPLADLATEGLEAREGVRLVAEAARAVAFAHDHDVVHRDLKPDNVLVTRDGRARLIDFGLAKALHDASGLTVTGVGKGAPSYVAPEQAADFKRSGRHADVYGLGGILYTVLTGKPPYTGRSLRDLLRKVQEGLLVPPRDVDPSIDPALDELCRRALAVDPARRPASAAEVADALEAWLRGR